MSLTLTKLLIIFCNLLCDRLCSFYIRIHRGDVLTWWRSILAFLICVCVYVLFILWLSFGVRITMMIINNSLRLHATPDSRLQGIGAVDISSIDWLIMLEHGAGSSEATYQPCEGRVDVTGSSAAGRTAESAPRPAQWRLPETPVAVQAGAQSAGTSARVHYFKYSSAVQ